MNCEDIVKRLLKSLPDGAEDISVDLTDRYDNGYKYDVVKDRYYNANTGTLILGNYLTEICSVSIEFINLKKDGHTEHLSWWCRRYE